MVPKDVRTGTSMGALNTKVSAFAKEMDSNCSLFGINSLDTASGLDDLGVCSEKTDMLSGETEESEF